MCRSRSGCRAYRGIHAGKSRSAYILFGGAVCFPALCGVVGTYLRRGCAYAVVFYCRRLYG